MVGTPFPERCVSEHLVEPLVRPHRRPFKVQTVTIPRGDYTYDEVNLTFNSNPARRVYEQFTFSPQTYYGGHRKDLSGTLGVRLNSRASGEHRCSATTRRRSVGCVRRQPEHPAARPRALSPRQTISLAIAYNSLTKQLSLSFRYNFIYRPGSDIYVTYDELQTDTIGAPDGRNRQFVVKTTYLLSR